MELLLNKIMDVGIIPVLTIDDEATAVPLGNTLRDAGFRVIEVTLRTPAAFKAIKSLSKIDGLKVGAGTVLTSEQYVEALENGARFIVTPGINETILIKAIAASIPIIPGVATASEIQKVIDYGTHTVKFFPAENIGGSRAISALSAPFQQVRFVPTGGINSGNLTEYLSLSSVLAVGGSWMVPRDLLRENKFDEIFTLSSDAVMASRQLVRARRGAK